MPKKYEGKFRVRRKNATFMGEIEGGAIVSIRDINEENVAMIDDGRTQDYIMVKDLERYTPEEYNTESDPYKIYIIKFDFRHKESGVRFQFDTAILAKSESEALTDIKVYFPQMQNFINMLDGYESQTYMYDDSDFVNNGEIFNFDVKEFNIKELNREKFCYTIPLVGSSGYYIDGYDTWEEMIKTFTTDRNDFRQFRRIYIDEVPNEISCIYFKGEWESESSIKAIQNCERRGVDPYGY